MKDQDIDNNNEELELDNEQTEESGPSKVSLFIDGIKDWINTQNKTVVYGVSTIFIAAIGIFSYQYFYKMPKEKAGIAAIFETEEDFVNDSFNLVLKTAPKLADEYSGTKAGNMAAYMAGCSYLYTGNPKKAIEYLEDVSFSDRILKPQSIGLLGDAHIENGDLESGLKQYLKAIKASKNEFSTIWWSKKAARVYEKQENWKKSLEIYQNLESNFKDNEELVDLPKLLARAKAKLGEY